MHPEQPNALGLYRVLLSELHSLEEDPQCARGRQARRMMRGKDRVGKSA